MVNYFETSEKPMVMKMTDKIEMKKLEDDLGVGFGVYSDGESYEFRKNDDLEIYISNAHENESRGVVRFPDVNADEKTYGYFKEFADKINRSFNQRMASKRQNFAVYLNDEFEHDFDRGSLRINLRDHISKELEDVAGKKAKKFGISTELAMWGGLAALCMVNFPIGLSCAAGYFTFGDFLFWIGGNTTPAYELGKYPMKKFYQRKILSANSVKNLENAYMELKDAENGFKGSNKMEEVYSLKKDVDKKTEKLKRDFESLQTVFMESSFRRGVTVEYMSTPEGVLSFCSYLINDKPLVTDSTDFVSLYREDSEGFKKLFPGLEKDKKKLSVLKKIASLDERNEELDEWLSKIVPELSETAARSVMVKK